VFFAALLSSTPDLSLFLPPMHLSVASTGEKLVLASLFHIVLSVASPLMMEMILVNGNNKFPLNSSSYTSVPFLY
jgi:hypothetical protein